MTDISEEIKTEVKAEAMHKTIKEMVHDLKYAQGMMNATVENAKELQASINNYVKRTNMEEYLDAVKVLTDDQITNLTKDELSQMFPGHNLMGWGDIDVKDIPGSFDYPIEEYRNILTVFRDNLQTYDAMVKAIKESEELVKKMTEIVRVTRINNAKNVAASDSPDADKAQRFLDDLDTINSCKAFFQYIKDHFQVIKEQNPEYISMRAKNKLEKMGIELRRHHPALEEMFHRLPDHENGVYMMSKGIDGYICYGDETTQRNSAIKKQTLQRLQIFLDSIHLNKEMSDTDQKILKQIVELDQMYRSMFSEECKTRSLIQEQLRAEPAPKEPDTNEAS